MRHEFSYFPGRASLPPRLVLPGPPSPKYVGIFFTSAPARRLAARALGFARRRFSGRRFPGCRRAGCSDAARAARTGRLFGLSLRARGGGQSAYAGLADAGAQLPLLQRRAEPESQVLPLRGDGRFGLRGRADSRAFRWPARARGLLPGGNVLLKWLGECADGVSSRIRGAAAISASLQPAACAKVLDSAGGYFYRRHLLSSVKEKAERFVDLHPGLIDINGVRRARTFHHFDRLVIAPLYGFRDELDYYRQADASPYLPGVRVKTLILTAEDDPIVPPHVFPTIRWRNRSG